MPNLDEAVLFVLVENCSFVDFCILLSTWKNKLEQLDFHNKNIVLLKPMLCYAITGRKWCLFKYKMRVCKARLIITVGSLILLPLPTSTSPCCLKFNFLTIRMNGSWLNTALFRDLHLTTLLIVLITDLYLSDINCTLIRHLKIVKGIMEKAAMIVWYCVVVSVQR